MIPASYWIFVAIVASLYPYQASAGPFHITLDYSNVPWTDQFFTHCAARNRWERVITGDLEDINNPNLPNLTPPTDCGRFPASIDDCYVCISYRNNMDGEGGILAVGFQNVLRSNALALIGSIEVDQTDIPSMKRRGIFRNVMISEIGAVVSTLKHYVAKYEANTYQQLGINEFVWNLTGAITIDAESETCTYRSNTTTAREWESLSGCTGGPPLASDCDGWTEECLQDEVMTGIPSNRPHQMSRLTVGTLRDIGYQVNLNKADRFRRQDLNSSCLCSNRRRLGTPGVSQSTPRRRLSDDMQKRAMAYGHDFMARNSVDSLQGDFLRGSVAVVYVEEGGEIFKVVVPR